MGKIILWPFEKTPPIVCIMIAGVLFFPSATQAQSKRKKLREEKAAAAQLKAEVMHHLIQLHAIEPQSIAGYFQAFMEQKGATPLHNSTFTDSFSIHEGNDYQNPNTYLSLNGVQLQAGTDFFPLHYSSNRHISGSAAPALNENGAPWFRNLADIISEHAGDQQFDCAEYCISESKRAVAKGATALLFYNTDPTLQDAVAFKAFKKDSVLPIPIVYITPSGWKKCNAAEVNTIDIDVSVHIQPKIFRSVNYVAIINHHADSTLLLYTRQPIEGLATMLSLTDVLKKQNRLNYVMVYQPYQHYTLAKTGLLQTATITGNMHWQYAIEINTASTDSTTTAQTTNNGYYSRHLNISIGEPDEITTAEKSAEYPFTIIPGIQYLFTKKSLTNSTSEKTLVIQQMIQDIQTHILAIQVNNNSKL
ncbi:MAG: hypothetical protein EO766_11490 [Hydrotalea sp. AMD]|uniref:hypothetical protein n=1 Tax=Hydrotalea sp. AMD TaxID=2501297 RepID=UPI001027C504|nr:hypothetical protein [Hydrotalea sp. AMD]RWZ87472.1 MAG: hypothetical protein EO766_11490 [Hydrotalea sp. AMD]